MSTVNILNDVWAEREAQDAKWGEQNHPVHSWERDASGYDWRADFWKVENDWQVKNGALGWDGILLEEVYEALAETDPDKQIEELIQVAAVAVAAIESIQRNRT